MTKVFKVEQPHPPILLEKIKGFFDKRLDIYFQKSQLVKKWKQIGNQLFECLSKTKADHYTLWGGYFSELSRSLNGAQSELSIAICNL